MLWKAPTCEASCISFSMDASYGVYLLSAALSSGRKVCFYLGYSDLASLHGMLEEVHSAAWLPVVAEHGDWLLLGTLVVSFVY